MALSKWGCSWEYHYLSCGLTFGWNTAGACPDPHQPLAPSHSTEKGHQAASMQGDRSRGLQAELPEVYVTSIYILKKKKTQADVHLPILCSLYVSLPRARTRPWMRWGSKATRQERERGARPWCVAREPQVLASESPGSWDRPTPMYLKSSETGFLSFSNKSISNQNHVLCDQPLHHIRLWDSMDCSLPGSSVHGDSPGKNIGMGGPCPPLGDLPNPGIEPRTPGLQADSWPDEPPGKS